MSQTQASYEYYGFVTCYGSLDFSALRITSPPSSFRSRLRLRLFPVLPYLTERFRRFRRFSQQFRQLCFYVYVEVPRCALLCLLGLYSCRALCRWSPPI